MTAILQRIPTLSIRHAIPGLLTVLIILAVGVTGWLSFRAGQENVSILANELSAEATTRIEEHVQEFIKTPPLVHSLNLGAINSGSLHLDNYDELKQYFWNQVHLSDAVPYAYYGAENGDFVGVDSNFGGGQYVYKVRDSKTAPNRVTFQLDDKGNSTKEIARSSYDPRTRPWYTSAVAAKGITWGLIYPSASAPFLVISPSVPVYDSSGKLQGVLGIDITLAELTTFLRALEVSPNGKAVIIERNGDMVATSSKESPFITKSTGEQVRVKITDSTEPLLRNIGNETLKRYGDFAKITKQEQFIMDLNNDQQFVQLAPVKDSRGIDWLVMVVIPASDFMDKVYENARNTLGAGVLVTIFAVILGGLLARWIIRPVMAVIGVAANIEKQQYQLAPLEPVASRSDELGQLARVVRDMARQVYQREQDLLQKVRELKIEVDEAKRSQQVSEIVDTDFFKELENKAKVMRQARRKTPPSDSGQNS